MEYGARSSTQLHFLHNFFPILKGQHEAVQIEGVILLEIPAKLEIFQPQVAGAVVIRQQLQIDVDIFNDSEVR
jgi:hypothetical protein